VRVGAATSYLRSDDPALLAEVLQARALSRLKLRRLAPTVLVTSIDAATVTSTLQAAGYLPAREKADGSLVLARPPAQRAPNRAVPSWRPPAAPDLAAIVADLRRAPFPPPAQPPPLPASQSWAPPTFTGASRPTEIAKGPRAVRAVLALACDEYWVVRLSYESTGGRGSELTVEPTDLDGRHLYANCFPDGEDRSFVIDRIEWVRVLTAAEEDLLS